VGTYFRYWAKAGKDTTIHLLPYHCLDVAAVGHVLLTRQPDLLRMFEQATAMGEQAFHRIIILFLALHDIGKFSETFQNLRPDLLQKLQDKISNKAYSIRHDSLGNLVWSKHIWLLFRDTASTMSSDFREYSDYWEEIFRWIAGSCTGHHGSPPVTTGPNSLPLLISRYFSTEDLKAVESFFHDLTSLLGGELRWIATRLSPTDIYESIPKASWIMAGFAVLCDWIGSNRDWFPFEEQPMPLDDYWHKLAVPRADLAVRKAGLGMSSPRQTDDGPANLFPSIQDPTPLQHHLLECPIGVSPQLFILEDVTGSGKTEAAFILAQRLMARGSGKGIFIALPTMATSNAMYERVAPIYRFFFTCDSSPSLVLAHGARHLSEVFLQSLSGYDAGTGDDSVQCSAWIADNRKKSLLADVGVGTLDQALLSILPSRFQSLRLFGLIGHILIVDEVHAYDPYMNKLLQSLLSFHGAFGGTAILLSATLPVKVRQELIAGFSRGIGMTDPPRAMSDAYPLVTHLSPVSGISETPVEAYPPRKTGVAVRIVPRQEEIEQLIVSAAEQGRCVCWIRNTVDDALTAFEGLRALRSSNDITLFHARFAMGDRLEIEETVLASFGRQSNAAQRCGKILIATQVVEQSLDLDFDLLISDLAPMDLLIQRAGRLHRHPRDILGNPLPPGSYKDMREPAVFIIHGPLPEDDARGNWYQAVFPRASFVYPNHGCLWLTALLLLEKGELKMPDDARELIESAFSEEADMMIPGQLRKRDMEAEARWQAERSLANINMLKLEQGYETTPNQWVEDMRTPTRLGDAESTVRLARWDGVRLAPWYPKGNFRWDMSQISLRAALVHTECDHRDPLLKAEIEQLKARLPDMGKWSVLVPLSHHGDGFWRGKALDRNGKKVLLSYDRKTGVTVSREE